jgi:hypothetical protein
MKVHDRFTEKQVLKLSPPQYTGGLLPPQVPADAVPAVPATSANPASRLRDFPIILSFLSQ